VCAHKSNRRVKNNLPADDTIMNSPREARKITSAIPALSVNNVRKCLDAMRKHWDNNAMPPLYSQKFPPELHLDGMSYSKFAYAFVLGQHLKRHKKKGQHE
jgi:hypothetical protein